MNLLNKMHKKLSCGFWNIGIIDTPIDSIINGKTDYTIRWLKHDNIDCFYADPFPVYDDGSTVQILAEEFNYFKCKGIIVELTIDKNNMCLKNRKVVLETEYHLSFPFVDDKVIVPEQYRSGKLYAYESGIEKCICDLPVIDPTLFTYNGEKYMIGTIITQNSVDANTDLYLLKKIQGKYVLVEDYPIKKDISSSRSAGRIFKIGSYMYRPAQDCKRIYGDQVRIMRISSILKEWNEEEVCIVDSKKSDSYNEGLHTLNVFGNYIIVDGFQHQYCGYRKILYVLYRYLKQIKRG